MSSKPKDSSVTLEAERTEAKRRKGKGKARGKGKGKKRNPCLKKYKDFCIHGTCQYLRDIRAPSCVWVNLCHSCTPSNIPTSAGMLTSCRPSVFAGATRVTLVTGVSFSRCPWRSLRGATTGPLPWPWWPWCCRLCVSSSLAFCCC